MCACRVAAMGLLVGLGLAGTPAFGQVVERERDVSITGPRGRTIERKITSERGPGFVERQVQVQRPGASLNRSVYAQRIPGFAGGGGGGGGYWRGPRGFYPREVIINNGGPGILPALAIGGGLFGLGMFAGSALASPPPPVYIAPPPVVMAPVVPAPGVVYPPPARVMAPPPATIAPDPGADALMRLHSMHDHSRRDGALTLGQLRDPRSVPSLIGLLKNDHSKEVRQASAWALGSIGDPSASVALQRAAMFDWRQEVRTEANTAYQRIAQGGQPAPAPGPAPIQAPEAGTEPALRTSAGSVPMPEFQRDDTPPPPPEPAAPPFRRTSSAAPRTGSGPGFPDSQ